MRIRYFALAILLGTAFVVSGFGVGTAESSSAKAAQKQNMTDLPISRVVLFSSGVGYFQRTGRLTGDQVVELTFRRSDVNDLLKSLVIGDSGGGRLLSVDYSSQDPLARALHSFPIDLSDSPGVAQILARARGAKVSLKGPSFLSGVIVGLESRSVAGGGSGGGAQHVFLNLLTADGTIRSVDLAEVNGIRFADPRIEKAISDALALISANRSTDTKRFDFRFSGTGTRSVSISYLIETPIWKTSYRLSVAGSSPAFLQGWAIVDNPTDDDWTGVNLDLVSGQPISFKMDLNQPVYNQRPTVPVPLPPSIYPQTYESGIASAPSAAEAAPPSASRAAPSARAPRPSAKAMDNYGELASPSTGGGAPLSLSQGVESAASAAEAGQFFQYSIKTPVTLPRHQSAMVPIVNQEIEGKPVAIYNENVLKSHPLSGLELKNSTGLHLMAGPITVFEDGVYAGDAEIEDLPPGGERLISYAVDLKTTVVTKGSSTPEEVISGKITHGNMIVTRRYERQRDFEFASTASGPRTILVEYPVSSDWKLVEPAKPKEQTSSLYRFEVVTDPEKAGRASLSVREQRTVSQTVVLSNIDSRSILFYIGQREISNRVKEVLSTLNGMKSDLAELTTQRSTIQSGIDRIYKEQERIRSNMRVLQSSSDLYKRYAATLGEQEDQLTAAQRRVDDLSAQIDRQKKRIDDYLASLGSIE